MKRIVSLLLILSQIFLFQSCFLKSLDKTMMLNTSISSTNVYNSGNHYYESSDPGFSYKPQVTDQTIMESYDFYSQPVGDPLGD